MSTCVICGAPTELLVFGVPMCVDCDGGMPERGPLLMPMPRKPVESDPRQKDETKDNETNPEQEFK